MTDDITIKPDDYAAMLRLQIITPMLDAPKGKIDATAKELTKQKFNDVVNKKIVSYSYRTIYRYYMNYKKDGFEGLKPKRYLNKGTHPSVPNKIINSILELKEELPSRSAYKIITLLELSNKVKKGTLKIRTVNRILKDYDYTSKILQNKTRVYVKHEKDKIGELWQSDVMSATYLPNENGDMKAVYLIAFIDDHARVITHAQFAFDATLPRLEDCLKLAIVKYGAPKQLYVDNGKIYISNNFKLICAKLGIRLIKSKPFHPEGKGKIEKFWDYVQSSFISEIKNNKLNNIVELNELFFAWLKREYHDKVHTSLGVTPLERWKKSLKDGARLKYFTPVQLDDAFLHYDERTVSKYGVISFQGSTYEVDGKLIGKKVGLKYDPFHLDAVHIYYKDKYYGLARVIDLKKEKHKDVKNIEEKPILMSDVSKKYFENIKSEYNEYIKQQIESDKPIDTSYYSLDDVSDSKEIEKQEETKNHVPDEKEIVIKRAEFVNIVSSSLEVEALTYIEKGKLYELWDTFKEFNKEILISIITDIKNKTPDFNKNFLYYLGQIESLYLKESNSKERRKTKNGS